MKAKEYPWLKLWSSKWLYGSGRMMTPEKRGIWIDLLALANEVKFRDGTLRFEVGRPMSRDYIANVLQIDRQALEISLVAFAADINVDDGEPRVKVWDDGTIQLTNWDKYQYPGEKTVAKANSIEKAQETKRRNEIFMEELMTLTNRLNNKLGELRYTITSDGKILDGETGEMKTLAELEGETSK